MKHEQSNTHPSAERLQALLEGQLPSRERAHVEEHVDGCARCSAELDAWRILFEDLSDLASHRPHEGFAERVMARVDVPEPRSLADRVRDRVQESVTGGESGHLAAEELQDFLEHGLAARRSERIERHLAACTDCAAEADAWLVVMSRLDGLASFTPSEGFAERVIAGVELAPARPWAARVRERVGELLGRTASEHVPTGLLQDWIDGSLPARAMARVAAHVDDCVVCGPEAEAWRGVAARLDGLGHLAPADGFVDRTLHRFAAARAAGASPARVPATLPALGRLRPAGAWALAAARRLVPQTRRAWAALSGVAVTPAVVVGLVFYAVFSHPTLTLGSLASFAWWQLTDLASVALGGLWSSAAAVVDGSGLSFLFDILASAPAVVAGGVVLYTAASALALRVLYKNLFANRPLHGRHAHVTFAS